MEQGPEKSKSYVEQAKHVTTIAKARIEQEFAETANAWPACVGSIAFVLETMLSSKSAVALLGDEKYEIVMQEIEVLKSRIDELFKIYPKKENSVPEEIKEEVYQMIEAIGEAI